jgi:flagellar hook-length control protein FliK
LPSVAAVFSADFRAGLSQPQNSVPEGDDGFSDLLRSIADVKDERRPDAPRVPERRADAPARTPKPEADTGRQAKREAADDSSAEGNIQNPSAPANPVAAEDGEETGEADTKNADVDADALLMLGLVQAQPEAPATPQAADAEGLATDALPSEAETPVTVAAAPLADAEANETAQAAASKQAMPFKARLDAVVAVEDAETDAEVAPPKISANTLSTLGKPLQVAVAPEGQTQTQAPAPLEILNAAISRHAQLALDADRNEPAPDAVKPLVSSNAVAPNFAMTAQINAALTAQTPNVADAARAVPVEQLAVEIATRANKGERRFDIRLDPPELGRIDVRLEIDSKGNTTARLIVERAETLDMLQRDARGLEKALQNAGLKTDAGGLQFSLQQDQQMQQGQHNHAPEMRGRMPGGPAEAEIITEIATGNAALAAQLRGGVDIRI